LAIMSTKGLSVTASRQLVDALCRDIPLLVLHDFDKSGFSIVGTLQRDTRRYEFKNEIRVVDLGLRLADVQANGLQSEAVHYGRSHPAPNLSENGATEEEIDFLCDAGDAWRGYSGRRVELNAFASGDLVAWVERKLQENGIGKVVPDADTLRQAFRRAAEAVYIRELIERAQEDFQERLENLGIPPDLEDRLRKALAERPALAWDAIVAELAGEEIDLEDDGDGDEDEDWG